MTDHPLLDTLPLRMHYAATVLEEANERYGLHADAPCSASWLRNEARHVEDEDKEAAEKEVLAEELARQLFKAADTGYSYLDHYRRAYIEVARKIVADGWTKS